MRSLTAVLTCICLITPAYSENINKSPWTLEFGPRYFLSTGSLKIYLSNHTGQLASRLTFKQWTGNAAEGFWQLTHKNNVFLKGYFGGGALQGGKFIDEDFPPGISPYSRTLSEQSQGSLDYFNIDLGYSFLNNATWRLGGFVGYHYWSQHYHALGGKQIASNTSVLGTVPPINGPVPTSMNVLNESDAWNSLRLGLNASLWFTEKLQLATDIAYLQSQLSAHDFHNLRADIRGIPEDGTGQGFQWDTLVNWSLSPQLRLGAGARWWSIITNGESHFEETQASGLPQPTRVRQTSYGLLFQANYQFDDSPKTLAKEAEASPNLIWQGPYLGGNIAYATKANNVYTRPASPGAQIAQINDNTPSTAFSVQDAGFLAGGELGYNWIKKSLLLGAAGDLDYAAIGATNAMTPGQLAVTSTAKKSTHWMGTLRGRLGRLASDDMLVYITSGLALGRTQVAFDQREAGINCPYNVVCNTGQHSKTNSGWVAGAGLEYAVAKHASFKAEYLYVDLGKNGFYATGNSLVVGPVVDKVWSSFTNNVFRLGLNVHA